MLVAKIYNMRQLMNLKTLAKTSPTTIMLFLFNYCNHLTFPCFTLFSGKIGNVRRKVRKEVNQRPWKIVHTERYRYTQGKLNTSISQIKASTSLLLLLLLLLWPNCSLDLFESKHFQKARGDDQRTTRDEVDSNRLLEQQEGKGRSKQRF